jgi:hypothetical protein
VPWTVEVTDEFETWWNQLDVEARVSLDGMIRVLEAHGPALGPPYSVDVPTPRHDTLRQLLVPHEQVKICVWYVSDELRAALVLLTGMTTQSPEQLCAAEDIARAEAVYGSYLARRSGSAH